MVNEMNIQEHNSDDEEQGAENDNRSLMGRRQTSRRYDSDNFHRMVTIKIVMLGWFFFMIGIVLAGINRFSSKNDEQDTSNSRGRPPNIADSGSNDTAIDSEMSRAPSILVSPSKNALGELSSPSASPSKNLSGGSTTLTPSSPIIQWKDPSHPWIIKQTLTREGYEKVYLDFAPDGEHLVVGWKLKEFNASNADMVDVYEWNNTQLHGEEEGAWVHVSARSVVAINYGVQMPSSDSIWVGRGSDDFASMQHVMIRGVNDAPLLEEQVSFGVEGTRGFNFDVQQTPEDEKADTMLILGYPYYSMGDMNHTGRVDLVQVNSSKVPSNPQVFYKGEYSSTFMGSSLSVARDFVAIGGISSNMSYPEAGPPASSGVVQVLHLHSKEPIGEIMYFPSNLQFVRVALYHNILNDEITLAVMMVYPTIELNIYKWNGLKWQSLGHAIVVTRPQVNRYHMHLTLARNRVAFGGPGDMMAESNKPGAVFVYEYNATRREWTPMMAGSEETAKMIQGGMKEDGFADTMAFSGNQVALSKTSEDGIVSVCIYRQ